MLDEWELPVRKRVVRLRETPIFLPRNSKSERFCQIFCQTQAIFYMFLVSLFLIISNAKVPVTSVPFNNQEFASYQQRIFQSRKKFPDNYL